jgi:hypothetical protein
MSDALNFATTSAAGRRHTLKAKGEMSCFFGSTTRTFLRLPFVA